MKERKNLRLEKARMRSLTWHGCGRGTCIFALLLCAEVVSISTLALEGESHAFAGLSFVVVTFQ
jgi:hypothetical protein